MRAAVGLGSVLALLAIAWPPGVAARQDAAPPRAIQVVRYELEATLAPAPHRIDGRGRLLWTNTSKQPTSELRFHLYWNAWRDTSSSWMRELWLGRNPRLGNRLTEDFAHIELTKLTTTAQGRTIDLLTLGKFIAPDDGNADDQTVFSVPTPGPVLPGETIAVEMAWASRVPRTFARTGVLGTYYFIAQWFPKIGVLEDSGWNCHQFHTSTEFFADFGRYDVTLNVPAGWVVGATGRNTPIDASRASQPLERAGSITSHRFVAEDVHDFAWTTSPDFVERTEKFDEPGLPKVDMRLLLQPEHVDQAARHFSATRAALKHYGTWFGAYPYDHITIVDPAPIVYADSQGGSTGGMEYPTLFTAGARWLAPMSGTSPENVTVHEAGHQFWYGIVATNEFENAWMDEGFNTFSTARVLDTEWPGRFVVVDRYFGGLVPWAFRDVPWSRDVDGNRLNSYRAAATADIPATPSWRYWPGTAGAMTYDKTALWLATLERHLGWPTLQRILSTYFAQNAFRHPKPDDFFAVASQVSGQDLTWFFDAVYRSNAVFDYGVAQVTSTPGSTTNGGAAKRLNTVVLRRYGTGVFPVNVKVRFDDATEVIVRWDDREVWRTFAFERPARVMSVEIDPGRVLLLDVNVTNNSWTAVPQGAQAARKWSLRWLGWLEELLLTYGAFV